MTFSDEQVTDQFQTFAKIELQRVSKALAMDMALLPVLKDIDLCVYPGQFVSLIGPSGCGKSTLLNIIAGLEEPSSGTLKLDGKTAPGRLGKIGYMHQKDLLLPWRTVLDNAVLGLELRDAPRPNAKRYALTFLDSFGLKGFERSYPYMLSGGMRQRNAFLRTVLADQDVILLDEPFGALDSLTRAGMQEWLLGLWESWQKTVVLVTHDVEEAVLLSDKVYVLTPRPGKVKAMVPVNLPRPRRYEVTTTEAFADIKGQVMAELRGRPISITNEEAAL